ncbi:MAG: branched-chain amino acid ABC transporter permease, partial [Alcaligenaceae bacterium]|nr:branched-chain amino acid ABC transporter permease [Alcaligenaceae bacterium]
AIDPTNWLAVLGIVLILIVRYAPDGLAGLVSRTVGKRSAK